MTVDSLVKYLRLNVSIQDSSNITEQDSAYLSMTDEDLILYMSVALTRNYPDVPSLDLLPTEYIYPVILLSKKELYYALAVKEAPLYDLGADGGYIKRSQRFEHYMQLVEQTDKEYKDYLENGGAGGNTLTSFDVLLSDRYATKRNYEKGVIPALALYIDEVGVDYVKISWKVKLSRFREYRVYISQSPILDSYNIDSHIASDAKEVAVIKNVHQTSCCIKGLNLGTGYYVAVSAIQMSSITSSKEESFTTQSELVVG